MDPRIQEYLERRLSEDERKIVSYSNLSSVVKTKNDPLQGKNDFK